MMVAAGLGVFEKESCHVPDRRGASGQSVGGQKFASRNGRLLPEGCAGIRGSLRDAHPPSPPFQCCTEGVSRVRACKTFVLPGTILRSLFFNIEMGGPGGTRREHKKLHPPILEFLLANFCPRAVYPAPPFAPHPLPLLLPIAPPSNLRPTHNHPRFGPSVAPNSVPPPATRGENTQHACAPVSQSPGVRSFRGAHP